MHRRHRQPQLGRRLADQVEGEPVPLGLAERGEPPGQALRGVEGTLDGLEPALRSLQSAVQPLPEAFAGLDRRLGEQDGRLAALSRQIEGQDGRLATLDQRSQGQDGRLAEIGQRLQAQDGRLGEIGQQLRGQDERLAVLGQGAQAQEARLATLTRQFAERDPALLEHAFARRVHIATPTTLISLLRTAAYAWQQQSLTENARAEFETGRDLHGRLATVAQHVDKLGRTLGTAVTDYNRTVGSLERTVLPASRRMADLGVVEQALAVPREVDEVARPVSAPHLLDAAPPLVAVPDEAVG